MMRQRLFATVRVMMWFAMAIAAWGHAAYSQQTNAPGASITIPSFTVPLPVNIAAWIAAHGLALFLAGKFLVKALDGYEARYPWVSYLVWFLQHATLTKDVQPLAARMGPQPQPPATTLKTPNGLPAWLIALGLLALWAAHTPPASAQSNTTTIVTNLTQTGFFNPANAVLSAIESNGDAYSGVAVNLKGQVAASLSQQLNLIGFGNTNAWLKAGVEHDTAFYSGANQEQVGIGLAAAWDTAPGFLRFLLFHPNNVKIHVGATEEARVLWNGFKGYNWKTGTVFEGSIGRDF